METLHLLHGGRNRGALRAFITALGVLFLVVTPSADGQSQAVEATPSEVLERLFTDSFDQQLELDPSFASSLGDRRFLSHMTVDIDPEWRRRMIELSESCLRRLEAVDRGALSPQEQLFADAFRTEHSLRLELLRLPTHLLPLAPGWGFTKRFAVSAAGSDDLRFDNIDDHAAYLSRVEDLEHWVDLAVANMQDGLKQGIVHPRSVVVRMIQELDGQLDGDPMTSVFAEPIRALPKTLQNEELHIWRRHLQAAVLESIQPAYRRLRTFLVEVYEPAARDSIALADLPGGKEWYRTLARFYTTTELTPQQIFDIGDSEVQRIRREMHGLASFLKGRESAPETQWKGIKSRFDKVEERIAENLPQLFHTLPSAPLDIRHLDPDRVAGQGAFYERPAADGSRPGTFYVDLRQGFHVGSTEALFLHEAVPGHHFQIALAQEKEDLPRFLRFGIEAPTFGEGAEGWGLYAESLGKYLGLYRHAEQRLGRLQFELGRAGRLVADVGIHYLGWDRKKAELELGRRRLGWALSEIDRYVEMPGQALSYKIGELHIQRLRQRSEERLGARFDIRDFHHQVLSTGPVPLTVLEHKIERWLEDAPQPAP